MVIFMQTTNTSTSTPPQLTHSRFTQWVRQRLLNQLSKLQHGQIVWHELAQTSTFGDNTNVVINLHVHSPRFYQRLFWHGELGIAESFIQGEWACDDLTSLFELILSNYSLFAQTGGTFISTITHMWQRWQRRNSLRGSKRNIMAHYDLSNAFYQLWLDKSMMYSSAIFTPEHNDLFSASMHKLATICRKLELKATDHVLEIGSGWGGFAIYAAKHHACQVTTTTISEQQYRYIQQRIQQENLQDKITVLKQDYRHLQGKYDKLVSIEMIEAVGHHYLKQYLQCCHRLLKTHGLFLLQAITINDQCYPRYRRQYDFIRHYIFPGGCLPAISRLVQHSMQYTRLQLIDLQDIGEHYARTLACWWQNVQAQRKAIMQLGFDAKFLRMWQYYLQYCEAGFRQHYITDVQMLWKKQPQW
jgi:cyclopropane-fatty-acyl-phospholipid synthase